MIKQSTNKQVMMSYHHVITKGYIYIYIYIYIYERILDMVVHSVGLAERSKKFF